LCHEGVPLICGAGHVETDAGETQSASKELLMHFATICRTLALIFEISPNFVVPAKRWRALSRL
jgi:hypothetical protein